ncbi:MAG: tetratricopeptide repeat protein [Pirellulales bacterium]
MNVRTIAPERLIGVALFAATVLAYAPVVRNDFVHFDDDVYITANPQVRGGLTAEGVRWAFTTAHASNWHPLTWLSHMLDCQLFGLQPVGHHVVNVLFHALNTVLVFAVLLRITRLKPPNGATNAVRGKQPRDSRSRPATRDNQQNTAAANDSPYLWRASLVAALVGLHPLRVESVAWAAERKDTLSTLFWWLSIAAYAAYVDKPNWRRYSLIVIGLLAGLMAKPAVVSLPVVLLLLDYWPLERLTVNGRDQSQIWKTLRRALVEKLPLALLCAAASAVTIWVQRRGGSLSGVQALPFSYRVGNALLAYVQYLGMMVWPRGLAPYYPHRKPAFDAHGVWQPAVLASLVLLVAITVAVVWLRKRKPYLVVGWFWYLVTLLPMIGLVQVGRQALADRYTYLPSFGIALAVVWSVGDLFDGAPAAVRRWLAVPALGLLIALAALTFRQVQVWRDDLALFSHAVKVTADNEVARHNLGATLLLANRPRDATTHLREAIRVRPDYASACRLLAIALAQQDQAAEAIRWYRETLRLQPDSVDAATELAWLYATYPDASLRDPHSALQLATAAVAATRQRDYTALDTLAAAYAENGRYAEAAEAARQAAELADRAQATDMAQKIAARATLYRQGQPYRESPAETALNAPEEDQ